MIRLGTTGLNHTLRDRHIIADRTARQATIERDGIGYAKELMRKNLLDLEKIMIWNADHGILFYRFTSAFAPHITNPYFIPKEALEDYTRLAYPLEEFEDLFKRLGNVAKIRGMRITFHPGQYTTLSAEDPEILIRSKRDLHFHTRVLELMDLDCNSVLVIHGGGIYSDKQAAMNRWIANFEQLPLRLRQRIVLENDEECYGIEDVLRISKAITPFQVWLESPKMTYESNLPIVFDIFHYYCYDKTLARRAKESGSDPIAQISIPEALIRSYRTWGVRRMKAHLSEQKPDAPMGAHSDMVSKIPDEMLEFGKHYNFDLMIEAKLGERAVIALLPCLQTGPKSKS